MNKKFIIAFILIAIVVIAGYNYLYQDHRNIAETEAIAIYSSSQLVNIFTDGNENNDVDVLDEVIEVTGVVTFTENKNITLDKKIFINMTTDSNIKLNEVITIKGRCLGYDDLMEEVKIDQAIKQ